MSKAQNNLIRKQYLLSKSNIEKLNRIADMRGTSAAEIVRQAIEAYDPSETETMAGDDLMELVSGKLKEAIKETRKANRQLVQAMATLSLIEGAT